MHFEPREGSVPEIDEENFSKLIATFAVVFPNIYKYLEAIKTGLDKDIQELKNVERVTQTGRS